MPDAEVKVFLEASIAERARRRWEELRAKGLDADRAEIEASIRERDERDRGRAVAPLRAAADAILVDTDSLTVEEVVARVVDLAREVAAA
jgi:cytidylate kinase